MNEKSNKTAVDWLIDQMLKQGYFDVNKPLSFTNLDHLQHQAKEIEKQQIIESWDNGFANGYDLGKHDDEPNPNDVEQYYNQTYKKD